MIFTLLFWLAALFVLYTYVGYPLLIFLAGQSKPLPEPYHLRKPPQKWPTVSIVIPVYNEAAHIERKIATLKALDYPQDSLSVTFVSDGSDDDTTEMITAMAPEFSLIQYEPREGKPTALNKGVSAQTADIIVFTDARQEIEASAIKRLVTRLDDSNIGAVSGELVFRDAESESAAQVGLYWRYEKWIRHSESRYASNLGVTGALYAIRRANYAPLYKEAILDDFEIPAAIIRAGKRVVFETSAHVFDSPQKDTESEKIRKIRTLTGNFQSFKRNEWLFSSKTNPVLWQFLSHKVFRLYVPYFLFALLILSPFVPHAAYKTLFIIQLLFYGAGFGHYYLPAHIAERIQNNKLGSFSKVFCELNVAAVLALKNHLSKESDVKWTKT